MIRRILAKSNWYKRVFLAKLGQKRKYRIGDAYISLEFTHRLPDYQSAHPYYDRFLPHLVKYLPSHSVVIDVGANVGDTLVGMIGSNPDIEYVCIEADNNFYEDLLKNVSIIAEQFPNSKVHAVNKFVGKDVDNVSLVGSGGTKHAVAGGGIKSEPLAKILKDVGIKAEISLIKTDVDGFDYDVIRSAYDSLDSQPFLYFECQYENNVQLTGYKELFSELIAKGYKNFSVFDNYGQFICSTCSVREVEQLLDYLYRQNEGDGTRTFHYYDILACNEEAAPRVESLILDYVAYQH